MARRRLPEVLKATPRATKLRLIAGLAMGALLGFCAGVVHSRELQAGLVAGAVLVGICTGIAIHQTKSPK